MAETKTPTPDETATEELEHTVSSGRAPRAGKNISFTLPAMPSISWRNIATRTKAFGVVGVLLLGMIGGFVGSWAMNQSSDSILSGSVSNQKKIVTSESELVSSIAKNVGPSVVSISVTAGGASDASNPYSKYFDDNAQQSQAEGTGIIISAGGLVLTNRHVVPSGTTDVNITLSDGTKLEDVSVIGRTTSSDSLDIAILKINNTKGHELTVATLGDSSKVVVGDDVVAIGNALGQFQNTVTSGIISGYGRDITAGDEASAAATETLENLFQTDAAINQGNSGGPLVNLNGQVIGINTAIASDSQNIGFAIPINDVKGLIDHVMKSGKFERPYLGVRYVSLTADIAKHYGLKVTNGAYIAPTDDGTETIIEGGPAAKAGLKTGDIITKVNGVAVDQTHSLVGLLGKYQPGDKATLVIVNGSDTRTVSVTLGTQPQ